MQLHTAELNENEENVTLTFLIETLWLSSTLLLCITMIVGCACCSLQFTRIHQRQRTASVGEEDIEFSEKLAKDASPSFGPSIYLDSVGGAPEKLV
ncbi:hypothetical protein niasHT_008650 [Heterodera trifolii]|uniref:Uncharacterized protein n=1 Tax=Heterodera trifolii TaxID=157864 RepID=A0ABD2MCE7_9BILA